MNASICMGKCSMMEDKPNARVAPSFVTGHQALFSSRTELFGVFGQGEAA